ncbi:hypothetical protein FGB62_123g018 [Gracilaria domingensis]|nr:hypothetical protein FGB62_123g018 [Gracilaria domingensis]
MSFPLWAEGLSRAQASHVILLFVRIILVAVPVYLETRLIAQDEPELISRAIQDALIPEPTDDWLKYQKKYGEEIYELRELGTKTYMACTYMEEDGWVWAKVANFTYIADSESEIRCVSNTQRRIYRLEEEIIDFLAEGIRENVTFSISLNHGRVQDFPPDLVLDGTLDDAKPNDEAFRVVGFSVMNDTNLDCFLADSVKAPISRPINGGGSIEWRGWCQRVETRVVRFYSLKVMLDAIQMNNDSIVRGSITSRNGTFRTSVQYRGSFEFRDRILVNAEHLANVDPGFGDSARASDVARQVLYVRAENISVEVPSGRVLNRTEMEVVSLSIGITEIAVVVVLALLLELGLRTVWRHVEEPNTVGGLSRLWAQSAELGAQEAKDEGRWVTLRLRKTHHEGEYLQFEPLASGSADVELGA